MTDIWPKFALHYIIIHCKGKKGEYESKLILVYSPMKEVTLSQPKVTPKQSEERYCQCRHSFARVYFSPLEQRFPSCGP